MNMSNNKSAQRKDADHFLSIVLCSDRYQKCPVIIIVSYYSQRIILIVELTELQKEGQLADQD